MKKELGGRGRKVDVNVRRRKDKGQEEIGEECRGEGGCSCVQTQVRIRSTVNRINGLGPPHPMSFPPRLSATPIAFRRRDAINLEDFLYPTPPTLHGFRYGYARVTWTTFSILFLRVESCQWALPRLEPPRALRDASIHLPARSRTASP